MKHLLQLLIIIFVLSVNLVAQKQFEMNVIMLKDTFLVGEEIDLGLTLTNITDMAQPIKVPGTIGIQIYDAKDNEVKDNNKVIGAVHRFGMTKSELKPKEADYYIYNLMSSFGNKYYHGTLTTYLEAGEYKIKIRIKSANNFIEEKIISINIIEPIGDELTFFNSFNSILSPLLAQKYDEILFLEQLQNLHKTYPNSVYSPILLDILAANMRFGVLKNEEKADEYRNEILEKYTWSGLNWGFLSESLKAKASRNEKIDYLNSLLPKSANSPMHKIIENYIKIETAK